MLLVHFTKHCEVFVSPYLVTLFIRAAYVYFISANNIYVFVVLYLDDSLLYIYHRFPCHLIISFLKAVCSISVFPLDKHIPVFDLFILVLRYSFIINLSFCHLYLFSQTN